ncbi:MAG: hydantoinase B/oxoprolinase family protein [Gammaproteobacteria bacterium]|nr:hydantoinase B/oxoprolinase family protein [Gammaproteobacteria bacterium]
MTDVDPISRDVFQHEVVGIAEEMSMALRRAAFSSIIWDMYDYACGLFTPDGEMLAQAQTIPAQLGIMSTAIHHMFEVIPRDDWHSGDVIVCNDPYRGCTHTPDIVLFSPVFHDDELIAIASTIAHHIDIGGRVPGTEDSTATEVFGEGLILPPLKLVESGKPNKTIFDIIAANVRDPHGSHGDLRAQIAGCRTGERRLCELASRYGNRRFAEFAKACLDYAEIYIRRSLAAIGSGHSEAEILIEDDAGTDEPILLKAAVAVDGENLTVDFTGSSAQRVNGLNCPISSTVSMAHYAVKAILTPDLLQNEGCNRPLKIIAPKGSILNPVRPAAVSVRHLTEQAVADVVLRALAPLSPSTAAAGCQISFPTFCGGGLDDRPERSDEEGGAPYYVISDILGGGMGAFAKGDGMSAIDTHGGNCAILSAEIMETMSPFRIRKTELVSDSGGVGEHSGGLGVLRDYELLGESSIVSGYLQQTKEETAPWGFAGGGSGGKAAFILNPNSNREEVFSTKLVAFKMKKGDVLRMVSSGGGGWGEPK